MTDKVQKIREEVENLHGNPYYIMAVKEVLAIIDSLQEEPVSKEIGDYDHKAVMESLHPELKEEPVSERFAFKAIPRLLEMIEPTDRAKVYVTKLADALEVEGYSTDAKIVMESLKIMNGEKVPMATMDEEPVSEELDEYINELSKQFPEVSFAKLSRIAVRVAKWKEQQLMANAVEDWITWLEKQGEHANFRNKIQVGDKVTRNEDGVLVNLSQLNRVAKKDEKQCEQKPAEWTMDNIEELTEFENAMMHIGGSFFGEHQGLDPNDTFVVKEQAKILLEMAPKQEWSAKDENFLNTTIAYLRDAYSKDKIDFKDTAKNCVNWLKSIKDRYTWKPSDEQMAALSAINVAGCISYAGQGQELINLYNDLKKLTE